MKAFENDKYDYYELVKPLGLFQDSRGNDDYLVPKGAIFVHDTDDTERGSISQGCLKLCWTPGGNCYGALCADTVVLHADFRNTDLFIKINTDKINKLETLISNLEKQLSEAKTIIKQLEKNALRMREYDLDAENYNY